MITKQGLVGNLRGCRAWEALETHYQTVRELHLRKLFADDPKRGERLVLEAVGLYLDYSKHRITRTQRLYPGYGLEHRLVRPVGGGTRQGPGSAHYPGT